MTQEKDLRELAHLRERVAHLEEHAARRHEQLKLKAHAIADDLLKIAERIYKLLDG